MKSLEQLLSEMVHHPRFTPAEYEGGYYPKELCDAIRQWIRSEVKGMKQTKEDTMVARKGQCGGTPRVGKKGDPKPRRGGRGRRRGRNR